MKVRMPQRATLSFSVSNPLGAADLLLHGENNLHGWGQFTFVDPTLLYVRGFDSTAKRYKYEVNPRFGSTNPQFNAFRAPVTLTMQVRVDVGPTRERQQLTQQLDRGRKRAGPEGARVHAQGDVRQRRHHQPDGADSPPGGYAAVSPGCRRTASRRMNRAYTIAPRQHLEPGREVSRRASGALRSGRGVRRATPTRARRRSTCSSRIAPTIRSLLTDEQRRKLPTIVASYLDTRYLAGIRSGTAGSAGGGAFGGGFIGGGGRSSSAAAAAAAAARRATDPHDVTTRALTALTP